MAAEVGVPLMTGVLDYGRGRYAEAVEALWSVRDVCHRFGGSHAQRDLVDQTLMDAAIRAGQPGSRGTCSTSGCWPRRARR